MPHDGQDVTATALLTDARERLASALPAADDLIARATAVLRQRIAPKGRIEAARLDADQHAAHALAWLATYVESLRQVSGWAERLAGEGRFGETEALLLQIGASEYLSQIAGGIPMSQGEMARLSDIDASLDAGPMLAAAGDLARHGNSQAARMRLARLIEERRAEATVGASGLDDELEMIREQFRRFSDEKVIPFAHDWHLKDELIPMELLHELAELGVFGLTIPEEHGGLGMPKSAMVVVSEELSRGYIGVGSLGTRSEIAAELILCGGTAEQKAEWLPRIASGEIVPTAVFTEPNTGSDLGSLRTRATKGAEGWEITGNKTWITHAGRANLMTVLARTDPASTDWRGLSMFLAPKASGTDEAPFPGGSLTGTEIEVLGYRGMKEYELAFDSFAVPAGNLLGGVEGQGFKQLMQTFEAARIQTAARAIGVAQAAMETGLGYALERKQFGQALIAFPRVGGKLAMMAAEIALARQLTYHAARAKDEGRRCDLEAGMAKLLAARVAWAAADNTLQIHGGNGFALEYRASRLLCDARILSIFEGAAEIQAQVIARRLLEG